MRHERSFDTYSSTALREISRKGGIASGRARRRKRELIEKKKIEDAALRERSVQLDYQYRESLKILCKSIKLLQEAQQTLNI